MRLLAHSRNYFFHYLFVIFPIIDQLITDSSFTQPTMNCFTDWIGDWTMFFSRKSV